MIKIPSKEEELQFIQAMNEVEEFTKMIVKKYPLTFKNGSGGMKIHPSLQHPFFPYSVDFFVTKKEE